MAQEKKEIISRSLEKGAKIPFREQYLKLIAKSDKISEELEKKQKVERQASGEKMLKSLRMSDWLKQAKDLPPITPLYAPWWNEGETCFFFGTTGVGKTLYAMQMAREISQKKKVLYFDFEMSSRQLLQRYNNDKELIQFSDNLIRVEMEKNILIDRKMLLGAIENEVINHEAQVIIIDNITWLLSEGQEAKHAIPFMQRLVRLKTKHNLSVMILAHTPKRKPISQFTKHGVTTYDSPIELADMAGSAALNNFTDSCFTIGKSRMDENLRYLKQLKNRSSEIKHGADNVAICSLGRDAEGFLSLEHVEEGPEQDHLQSQPHNQVEERQQRARELKSQGLSHRDIAAELGVTHTTIRRDLQAQRTIK